MKSKLGQLMKNRAAVPLTFLIVSISLLAFLFNFQVTERKPAGALIERSVLVIDAGHGGIDGGAIGVDGSRESDINLAIALKLHAMCSFYGIETVMTRVDDSRANDALTYSEHGELVYRTELVNSVDNAVLLSIHQNCFPTAQPSGPQVLYSDNGSSKRFGEMTHSNLVSYLYPDSRRLAEPDKSGLYVLSNVTCPAILVECGFISNHSDISKLTSGNYQTAVSSVLMASYIQYIQDNTLL